MPAHTPPPDLAVVVARYVDLLTEEGIPDPLGTPMPLALVLADLLTLAGLPVPRPIATRLDEPCGVPLVAA